MKRKKYPELESIVSDVFFDDSVKSVKLYICMFVFGIVLLFSCISRFFKGLFTRDY